MRVSASLTVSILLSAAANAQTPAPFSMKAESAVYENTTKEGGWTRRTVNKRFDLKSVSFGKEKQSQDILLIQTVDRTFRSGEEGSKSTVTVTAKRSGKKKYDTTLWTTTYSADAGEIWYDFYSMTKYGCCGAENAVTLFQLRTGSRVASFTGQPVFAEIPNSPVKRIVSYLSANAAEGFEERSKRGIGILTLSSDEQMIDRVLLMSDSLDLAWTPRIVLVSKREPSGTTTRLDLWDSEKTASPEGVTGFEVKLRFIDNSEAIVPVRKDRFNLDSASTNAMIHFQHLPPTK